MADTKKLKTLKASGTGSNGSDLSRYIGQEANPQEQAWKNLQAQQAAKPQSYSSGWEKQMNDLMGQIQNRKDFSYDINADALWNQYKDQYVNLGRQAMMDTMGQAQAMTGGYGNSYAQMAGQQAYQGYMQGLTDKVPELYGMAMDKYRMEGDALLDRYGLLVSQESMDYDRYMDAVNQYYAELDRLQGIYDNERAFEYQQNRDAVSDKQWQTEWDEYVRRYNFENKLGEFAEETPSGGGEEEQRGSGSKATANDTQSDQAAKDFVNRMLDSATSSRFDPERVINSSNQLTKEQKKTAKEYLEELLDAGYMR